MRLQGRRLPSPLNQGRAPAPLWATRHTFLGCWCAWQCGGATLTRAMVYSLSNHHVYTHTMHSRSHTYNNHHSPNHNTAVWKHQGPECRGKMIHTAAQPNSKMPKMVLAQQETRALMCKYCVQTASCDLRSYVSIRTPQRHPRDGPPILGHAKLHSPQPQVKWSILGRMQLRSRIGVKSKSMHAAPPLPRFAETALQALAHISCIRRGPVAA